MAVAEKAMVTGKADCISQLSILMISLKARQGDISIYVKLRSRLKVVFHRYYLPVEAMVTNWGTFFP